MKLPEKKRLLRLGLKWGIRLFVGGITAFLLLVILVYFEAFGALPNTDDLKAIQQSEASLVYTQDGVLIGKYFIENRDIASAEELPEHLIQALLATEDARFMEHSGIDYRALGRVMFKTILMGDDGSGGGSTLSQQLIKNLYPRNYHGFLSMPVAKIRESIAAKRLEKVYSKREIIWLYLNTVPFGEDVYGIETAAERYFSKPISEVNLQEAATLIGMLKGPNRYHPIQHPERSKLRRNVVLKQMTRYDFLKDSIYDSVQALDLEIKYQRIGRHTGLAPYLRERARLWLETWCETHFKPNGKKYNPYTDGLVLHLTIDAEAQGALESSVEWQSNRVQERFEKEWGEKGPWLKESFQIAQLKKGRRYQVLEAKGLNAQAILDSLSTPVKMRLLMGGKYLDTMLSPIDSLNWRWRQIHPAAVSIDPKTGRILAWVGGKDFSAFPYDHVLASRQVGSTFKPLVYLNALMQGAEPCDYFEVKETLYPEYDNWNPQNSGGPDTGYYSLAGALANSVNTVSAELAITYGVKNIRDLAKKMGFDGEIPLNPSIALGTVSNTPLNMAVVYSGLTNGGKKVKPRFIDRLETKSGEILFQGQDSVRAYGYDTNAVAQINQMLMGVVDSGTGRALRSIYQIPYEIGGKTGTSQDNADAWFLGVQEELVTMVWFGGSLPSIHFRYTKTGQGAAVALPVFGRYVNAMRSVSRMRNRMSRPIALKAERSDCPNYLPEKPKGKLLEKLFSWFGGNDSTLVDSTKDTTGLFGKIKGWFSSKKEEN